MIWRRCMGMFHSLKKAGVLVFALAAIMFLSVPTAQAQDQPPAGALRGYVSPPPGEGYPTQPVPPPLQLAPRAATQRDKDSEEVTSEGLESKEKSSRRLPSTVAPPPESPYDVNMAKLELKVVGAGVMDRISFAGGAQRKPLEPGPGKKLVVAVLQGKASTPIRMPIAIMDFSAFYVEEHVRNLYGKRVSDRIIQVARAVALETPRGWLTEGEGLPNAALFYFVDPGPVTLRVGFLLPVAVKRFGVRYPMLADGEATVLEGTSPSKN
jgi:hypothetical protein